MATLSAELKRRIAELYLNDKQRLDALDPDSLESFASSVVDMVEREKEKTQATHDLEVLEQSMKHLKQDSVSLKNYKRNTDDYDFTLSDCRNLLDSTKTWLRTEGLI